MSSRNFMLAIWWICGFCGGASTMILLRATGVI